MQKLKVAIVEDDESIRNLVQYALENSGMEVSGYCDGRAFTESLSRQIPQTLLLDIMLPDEDGISILRRLKSDAATAQLPVIMLTAKSGEFDKVQCLDSGADDYVVKPFGVMELISRIRALARRSNLEAQDHLLTCGGISVDIPRHRVWSSGEEVQLTLKEFDLLALLMSNRGVVLNRDRIMSAVWSCDFEGETRTIDIHVNTLRKKLGENGALIQTVRGIGYKVSDGQ